MAGYEAHKTKDGGLGFLAGLAAVALPLAAVYHLAGSAANTIYQNPRQVQMSSQNPSQGKKQIKLSDLINMTHTVHYEQRTFLGSKRKTIEAKGPEQLALAIIKKQADIVYDVPRTPENEGFINYIEFTNPDTVLNGAMNQGIDSFNSVKEREFRNKIINQLIRVGISAATSKGTDYFLDKILEGI